MFGRSVSQIGAAVNRAERERAKKKIRRISKQTMQRYSEDQLANHLEICMSKMDKPKYRVDQQYKQILELNDAGDAYVFRCCISISNKPLIREMIRETYRRARV